MTEDLDALLRDVLAAPPSARAAHLDAVCPDAATRAALERMVREHDDEDPFLRAGGAVAGAFADDLWSALEAEDALTVGTRVGPYRVTGEFGRGGMAVVYRAERCDGAFAQLVALKVVKRGMDSADIVARFRQERQILASLTHPNIAGIVDGGVTDDGLPYFAMEAVDGEPIDQYCQGRHLDVPMRVDLCVAVARAVQYAHRHLVVHRDLKPSNILVAGDGTVKLLDFGIAKLLAHGSEAAAPRTLTAVRAMTPEYASPEQVAGQPITTASDIYQLGLVLFEVLAGQRARPAAGQRASGAERAAVVPTAPRPSAVVSDVRRRRQLRGDLDTIVATALAADPAARYGSVQHLVDDLVAHRCGRPIAARPITMLHRAAKFVWRHRIASAATAAAVLLVVGIVTYYSVQLARERDAARREAETATRVADFVTGLFSEADPVRTQGATLTAEALLAGGVNRIEAALAADPDIQARLWHVVGNVYVSLGLYANALPLFERSLETRRARRGAMHPEVADSLYAVANVLDDLGRYDAARAPLEEALRIRTALLGPEHADVGHALNLLGALENRAGRMDTAESLQKRALAIHEKTLDPWHPAIARDLDSLASVYLSTWQNAPALEAYLRSLAIDEHNYGADDMRLASKLAAIANVRRRMGVLDAARPDLERALAISRKVYGSDHPQTGHRTNVLALLLADMGRHDDARVQFEQALDILTKALGPEHPSVAPVAENLGKAVRDLGDHDRALGLFRQALAIRVKAHGPVHVEVSQTLESEGTLLLAMRDYAAAEPVLRRALDVTRKTFEPGHARIGRLSSALGACLAATRRQNEAERLLLDGLSILTTRYGANHAETALARNRVVDLYDAWGRPDQAARHRANP